MAEFAKDRHYLATHEWVQLEGEEAIAGIHEVAPDAWLIAKPNAGIPHTVGRQVVFDAGPEEMAGYARRFIELGVRIVGGCCGSTPAHIAAIAAAIQS